MSAPSSSGSSSALSSLDGTPLKSVENFRKANLPCDSASIDSIGSFRETNDDDDGRWVSQDRRSSGHHADDEDEPVWVLRHVLHTLFLSKPYSNTLLLQRVVRPKTETGRRTESAEGALRSKTTAAKQLRVCGQYVFLVRFLGSKRTDYQFYLQKPWPIPTIMKRISFWACSKGRLINSTTPMRASWKDKSPFR